LLKSLFILDRAGKFLLGTFFLVISFSVLALGVVLYQSNPEHLSKRGAVDNLGDAQQFVIEFKQNHKRLPELEEFNAWAHEHSGDPAYGYRKSDFPKDLIRLAGEPPQDAYYFNAWNGDIWAYYASWYENGTVGLITDKDYYWGGSRLMHSIIFIGLFLGFGLIASFFYSLAFEKSTTRPKNPA